MAKELRVRKRGGKLIPYRTHDAILLEDLPDEVELKAVITQPRSVPHNSKYWVLLKKIVDNQHYFPSPKVLHGALKEKLGYNTVYKFRDGTEYHHHDSTAFDSMTQDEFELYYKQAIQVILTDIVPHLNNDELEREIVSF